MALRGESRVHHSANMDSNNHQIVLWERKKIVGLIGSLFEFREKRDVDLGFTDFLVAVHLSLPVKMWETPEKEKQIVVMNNRKQNFEKPLDVNTPVLFACVQFGSWIFIISHHTLVSLIHSMWNRLETSPVFKDPKSRSGGYKSYRGFEPLGSKFEYFSPPQMISTEVGHTSFSFHTLGGFLKRRYFDIVLLKHQNYHSALGTSFFFFFTNPILKSFFNMNVVFYNSYPVEILSMTNTTDR